MTIRQITLAAAAGLSGVLFLMPAAAPAAQDDESAQAETAETGDSSAPADAAEESAPAGATEESASAEAMEADAAAVAEGAALFAQRCMACHSAEPGQISYTGPNLAGVVGRPAASTQFRYSPALRNSGLTWTPEELDAFLASPLAKVPGTSMYISLPDAAQRQAVIAYLATTSNEPAPQP